MPIITVFSGTFCREDPVVQGIAAGTGYPLIEDEELISEAAQRSGIPDTKIQRALAAKASVFNKFTHERERSIAHLKLALAQRLSGDRLLIMGFAGLLIPREITHVLRVCLIAELRSRLLAAREHGISENEALKLIRKEDEDRAAWAYSLWNVEDPWDASLYDMVIPTDKADAGEIGRLIRENLSKEVVQPTGPSKKAADDFLLAARVEAALVQEGHNVGVKASDGALSLTINKHVLMLSRLEGELKTIAGKVPGVREVETKVGPEFYQADIYRKYDFEIPSKILLVDDEREFVQTLSERLLMRDMGSAVAYDGESALEMVREDEPEVLILDLKMPGIDGIEVLRRVKATQPEIEVIILTGHGSETDRQECMELGAFAYLQKPVDIDKLSETLRRANEKIRGKKGAKQPGN